MTSDVTDPPLATGDPLFAAVLKQHAADFRVAEQLDIAFTGSGEHLYLHIEKTSMNSDEIVSLLQQCYSVESADIGLSGLKDRHAVTCQWFSVRTVADASVFMHTASHYCEEQNARFDSTDSYVKSIRLKESHRHARKLKRGAHKANRFSIVLRGVKPHAQVGASTATLNSTMHAAIDARVILLRTYGFPNYIGAQRFGYGAQNLQRASQWFARPKKRCSRQQRSLWLSAARSAVFNTVCAARVRDGSWQTLMPGEPAVLDGSRSFFSTAAHSDERETNDAKTLVSDTVDRVDANTYDTQESLEARLKNIDIHPSGPWWGRGRTPASGACADYEALVLARCQDLCAGLEKNGLAQERRALRAMASDLSHRWLNDENLQLSFSLHPGVFATSLIRELGSVREPQR